MALKTKKRGRPTKAALAREAAEQELTVSNQDQADEWRRRLEREIKRSGRSVRQISMAAGLNAGTLSQTLKSGRMPGATHLLSVCEQLGVSIHFILTGEHVVGGSSDAGGGAQLVPVLHWASVLNFIDRGEEVMIIREETAPAIEPPGKRFRLDFAGNSMAGMIEDGDIIDCSGMIAAEPEDIVIAYRPATGECVARTIIASAFDDDGNILSGWLQPANESWPRVPFDVGKGDRIVAVVLDITRPIKRGRRRAPRRLLH